MKTTNNQIEIKHYIYIPEKCRYSLKKAVYDEEAYKRLPNYVFGSNEIEDISTFIETPTSDMRGATAQMQRDRAALIKQLCKTYSENDDEEVEIGYIDEYMRVIKGPLMELFLLMRPIKVGWPGIKEKMFVSTHAKITALKGAEFSHYRVVDGIIVAVFHGGIFPPYNDDDGHYHKAESIPLTNEMWIAFS